MECFQLNVSKFSEVIPSFRNLCHGPSRSLHGGPWRLYGGLHDGPWSSVEISMEVRGGLHGGPWRSMEPQRNLHGTSTEPPWSLHGSPWSPRGGLHGASTDLHGGLNYVNKKYIFSYCSSINKKCVIHQYSFKLKWFNCLYLLFFKGFNVCLFFCAF